MIAGTTFAHDGVSPDMIGIGEPRLRRSRRTADQSWFVRAGAVLRGLRPAATQVPVLGR
ncbi:MAG: hypothetical protein M3Q47_03840 [Actinomycetota bacterium]|nr:hypothetical protein [Actinomycetota bacterium]